MGILKISLFGYMRIEREGWPEEMKLPYVVRNLLAFLLKNPHRYYPREVLMTMFWEDYPTKRARNCLSTALWRVRQVLEPTGVSKGTYLSVHPTGEIGFNWNSAHWVDVKVFEETTGRLTQKSVQTIDAVDVKDLEEMLNLYTGDFLEGFYDDWAIRKREELRQLYLAGLEHLMLFYKSRKAYKQSLAYGHRILDQDPLRESIHRELMRIYWKVDQPVMAVRQYQICKKTLAQELDITPMIETQSLYNRIISEAGHEDASNQDLPNQADFRQAMYQLRLALEESHRAQVNLERAAHLVQQYANFLDLDTSTTDFDP